VDGHGPALTGVLDAGVNGSQSRGVNFDFFGDWYLELQVSHSVRVARTEGEYNFIATGTYL